MHKSKYFDKAGEMAISKLMPKPDISISINMAGGGGLSSISEPIINRVSGGEMIGEDFFGGYTDEYAGVSDDDLQDDPTQAPTPTDLKIYKQVNRDLLFVTELEDGHRKDLKED